MVNDEVKKLVEFFAKEGGIDMNDPTQLDRLVRHMEEKDNVKDNTSSND